jgi:hypothetical protein
MRRTALLVIGSGIGAILVAALTPIIIRWGGANLLERFDALEHLPLYVQVQLESMALDRLVASTLGCFAVIAGILMLRGHGVGRLLAMISASLFILSAIYALPTGQNLFHPLGPYLRAAWWAIVLFVTFRTVSRQVSRERASRAA